MAATPLRPLVVGKPLALTPAELDMAAIVTPVDVAMARNLWAQHSPPRTIDILEAMEDQ